MVVKQFGWGVGVESLPLIGYVMVLRCCVFGSLCARCVFTVRWSTSTVCRANSKVFGCYMVKPRGQLGCVSSTSHNAYTPHLSTSYTSTALQGARGSSEISS